MARPPRSPNPTAHRDLRFQHRGTASIRRLSQPSRTRCTVLAGSRRLLPSQVSEVVRRIHATSSRSERGRTETASQDSDWPAHTPWSRPRSPQTRERSFHARDALPCRSCRRARRSPLNARIASRRRPRPEAAKGCHHQPRQRWPSRSRRGRRSTSRCCTGCPPCRGRLPDRRSRSCRERSDTFLVWSLARLVRSLRHRPSRSSRATDRRQRTRHTCYRLAQ